MLADAGPSLLPASIPTTPAPAFPIRLIALDIDGTIIGDDHEVGAARSRPCAARWNATSRCRW